MMKNNNNGSVNIPTNSIEYEVNPVSVKLTKKTKEMLDYMQYELQISKSDIIRMSITKFYTELKEEGA